METQHFNLRIKYFMGCINLYFFCEMLKASSLVSFPMHRYNTCISVLKKELQPDDLKKVCDILNQQEDLEKLVINLIYMLLMTHGLNIVNIKEKIGLTYWSLAHVSAFVLTLLAQVKVFQFSITSETEYTGSKIAILTTLAIFFAALIIYQIVKKKLCFRTLFGVIGLNLFLLILLKIFMGELTYHFHHAFCACMLTLCFRDFETKISKYVNAVLLGIIIQGINFYNITDTIVFNLRYTKPPKFEQLIFLLMAIYPLWLITYCGGLPTYLWTKIRSCRERNEEVTFDHEIPLLVPNLEEF